MGSQVQCEVPRANLPQAVSRGRLHVASQDCAKAVPAIAIVAAALSLLISVAAGSRPAYAAGERDVLSLDQAVRAGPSSLQAVAWSPDGKHLAVAGSLPETQIWDANDLRLQTTLPGGPLAFTAFARRNVSYSSNGGLLAAGYGTAALWTTSTWQRNISLIAPIAADPRRFGVQSLLFSSNNRRLIVAYAMLAPQKTPPIFAYDAQNGSIVWSFRLRPAMGGTPRITTGLQELGTSDEIAFGTFETVGGANRDSLRFSRVVILNSGTGSLIRTIDHVHVDRITAMAVSDDGRWIATGTTTGKIENSYNIVTKRSEVMNNRDPVRIWDTSSGTLVKEIPVKGPVAALSFSAGSRYLFEAEGVSYGHEILHVWDLANGSLVQSLATPRIDNELTALAISPNGRRLAAVGTGIATYAITDAKSGSANSRN